MRSFRILFTLFITMFLVSMASAQNKNKDYQHETNTDIKELADFHEVIYPIWHVAYPAKDCKALREYVSDVNAKAKKIYSVKLPGIFRERVAKWKDGVKEFKAAVVAYNKAAKGSNDEVLLNAAEKLHGNYEKLIRIVYPYPEEVDAFHQDLYVVYHKFLPANNYAKIIEVSDSLIKKAEAIKEIKISKRLESKKESFLKESEGLISACKDVKSSTKDSYKKLVEDMHSQYQKLAAIFE